MKAKKNLCQLVFLFLLFHVKMFYKSFRFSKKHHYSNENEIECLLHIIIANLFYKVIYQPDCVLFFFLNMHIYMYNIYILCICTRLQYSISANANIMFLVLFLFLPLNSFLLLHKILNIEINIEV